VGRITVPVLCYLIEHPKGQVLFDSRLHATTQFDPRSRIGVLADEFQIDFRPGEEIAAQLEHIARVATPYHVEIAPRLQPERTPSRDVVELASPL